VENMTETTYQPWERMDGETDSAWSGFRYYRDLPPMDRTLLAAWYDYRETKDGERPSKRSRVPGYFQKWSSLNDWTVRVRSFDRFNDAKAVSHAEIDHLGKLNAYRARLLNYAEISTSSAIRSMRIIARTLEAMDGNEEEGIAPQTIEARHLPKFIQATAKLFETAAEQEGKALAVDSLLEVLSVEGKLEKLH
jgi:hypothetical protein